MSPTTFPRPLEPNWVAQNRPENRRAVGLGACGGITPANLTCVAGAQEAAAADLIDEAATQTS